MCLAKLEDFKVRLNKYGVGNGWKIFTLGGEDRLEGQFTTAKERQRGKWLDERGYRYEHTMHRDLIDAAHKDYPYGWHVFLRKRDAIKWNSGEYGLIKIRFKRVVTTGRQECYKSIGGLKVIVAKEIFIPKQ